MGNRSNAQRRASNRIIVRSEIVSDAEAAKRRKRLLDVKVSKAPDGADVFVVEAPIAAAAEEVYGLVDWADERNKYRQMGDEVTQTDKDGRNFRLVIGFMDDLRFDCEVVEATKPHAYGYNCIPTPSVGHLERSYEHYRIVPTAADECVATYTMTAYFEAGLSEQQRAEVMRNMTIACHNGMAKLKPSAEYGVGTWEAFENTHLMSL